MNSPYATARRMALAAHALLMPSVVVLAVTQSPWCFLPAGVGFALLLRAQKIACPVCEKPLMRRYFAGRQSWWRRLLSKGRGMPERRCSECGEGLAGVVT